jgi:release factor glutamine methyltransferase
MITVLEAIKLSTVYLDNKKVESARANAEILLAEVLSCKRLELYLSFDKPLKEDELNLYREYIKKRGMRIPVQYIIGNVDFFGLKLIVNESVLIPRPETELLVEQVIKDYSIKENIKILDIGAGSGNISIALSKNLKKSEVLGIDISEKALELAKQNAAKNFATNNIVFKKFDIMVDEILELGKFDFIVSNPPYVSLSDYKNLEPELKDYEPIEALTDNADGLSFYRKIISSSNILLNKSGKVYFEIGKDQHKKILKLMSEAGFVNTNIVKDYSGIERIICGELI